MKNEVTLSSSVDQLSTTSINLAPESLGDFDLLADAIFELLLKELEFVSPAIGMFNPNLKELRILKHNSHPKVDAILFKVMGKHVTEFSFSIEQADNLLIQSFSSQNIIVTSSMGKLGVPYVTNQNIVAAIDAILGLKMVVIVPIIVEGASIGVFAFGSKIKNYLSEPDKFFLKNLCAQIGVYLKQAWTIKLLKLQNASLYTENEQLLRVIKTKRSFLLSLTQVLKDEMIGFDADSDVRKKIEEHISYMQSLALISDFSSHDADKSLK